jgi:hypothetical protein
MNPREKFIFSQHGPSVSPPNHPNSRNSHKSTPAVRFAERVQAPAGGEGASPLPPTSHHTGVSGGGGTPLLTPVWCEWGSGGEALA